MAETIDELSIKINTSAGAAVDNIMDLAVALESLKSSGKLTTTNNNLTNLGKSIDDLVSGMRGLDTSKLTKLSGTLNGLAAIQAPEGMSAAVKVLRGANKAISELQGADLSTFGETLKEFTSSLSGLKNIEKLENFTRTVTALKAIPKMMEKIDSMDLNHVKEKMTELADAMKPLAERINTVAEGFGRLPSKLRDAVSATNRLGKQMASGLNARAINLNTILDLARRGIYMFSRLLDTFDDVVSDAIEWDGIKYRFGRAFGEDADEVYAYIQKLNSALDINKQTFMQYSSLYGSLLSGFGLDQSKVTTISVGLTELTYDLWASQNDRLKTLEEASNVVRSAISGEIEPIRNVGIPLSQNTLQEFIDRNTDLEISFNKLTDAQKAEVRYAAMVEAAMRQGIVGTYAQEIHTAEGAFRNLAQQVRTLGQTFGGVLIPILSAVLPYLSAIVKGVTAVIQVFAQLFGVKLFAVDWSNGINKGIGGAASGAEDLSNGLGGAAKNAKKIRAYLMDIDELNVLPSPNEGGGGGGAGGGVGGAGGDLGLDLDTLWSDSVLAQANQKINDMVTKMKEWLGISDDITTWSELFNTRLGNILIVAGLVGGAIAAWKISTALQAALATIQSLSSGKSLALSVGLTVAGFTIEGLGIKDALDTELNGFNFWEIILGGATAMGGASLLAKTLPAFIGTLFGSESTIAAVVTGVSGLISPVTAILTGGGALFTGVWDALTNGLDWLSGLLIPAGTSLAGAGIGAIIGSIGGPLGALIGLLVGVLVDLGIYVAQHFEEIKKSVTDFWNGLTGWLGEKWDSFVNWGGDQLATISKNWTTAIHEFWDGIKYIVTSVGKWLSEKADLIMKPFADIGDKITETFRNAKQWIHDHFITPVQDMFRNIDLRFPLPHFSIDFEEFTGWAYDVLSALGLPTVYPHVNVDWYANGGFPNAGELFVAREAGAEMVGSIGGHTAVANNDQIVAAVSKGVADAVRAVMGNGGRDDRPIQIILDGKVIADSTTRYQRQYARAMGG